MMKRCRGLTWMKLTRCWKKAIWVGKKRTRKKRVSKKVKRKVIIRIWRKDKIMRTSRSD